jgi:hypothetical protein
VLSSPMLSIYRELNTVTRNSRYSRLTVEELAADRLDVRDDA